MLLLAGDASDDLRVLEQTLTSLRDTFGKVFFLPGRASKGPTDCLLLRVHVVSGLVCRIGEVLASPSRRQSRAMATGRSRQPPVGCMLDCITCIVLHRTVYQISSACTHECTGWRMNSLVNHFHGCAYGRNGGARDSYEKLQLIFQLCTDLGIQTRCMLMPTSAVLTVGSRCVKNHSGVGKIIVPAASDNAMVADAPLAAELCIACRPSVSNAH